MLVWAWRLVSRRGMGSVAVRLASLLGAIPVVAAVLASLASAGAMTWPTLAGPGGASGRLLAEAALGASGRLAGPAGEVLAWLSGVGLSVVLVALALGLTVFRMAIRRAGGETSRATPRRAAAVRAGDGWDLACRCRSGCPISGRSRVPRPARAGCSTNQRMMPVDIRPEYEPFDPEPPMDRPGSEPGADVTVPRGPPPRARDRPALLGGAGNKAHCRCRKPAGGFRRCRCCIRRRRDPSPGRRTKRWRATRGC